MSFLAIGRWLLFSEYGRYTLLGISVLTVAFIYRHELIEFGKNKGHEEQRTEQVQGIKQGLDSDRAVTHAAEKKSDAQIAVYKKRAEDAETKAAQSQHEADSLKVQQDSAKTPEEKLPICEQRVDKYQDAILQYLAAANAQTKRFNELMVKYENKAAYTERLESRFVELWNSNPPKKRSGKCLWAWKCGKDKLKPPPLEELQADAP